MCWGWGTSAADPSVMCWASTWERFMTLQANTKLLAIHDCKNCSWEFYCRLEIEWESYQEYRAHASWNEVGTNSQKSAKEGICVFVWDNFHSFRIIVAEGLDFFGQSESCTMVIRTQDGDQNSLKHLRRKSLWAMEILETSRIFMVSINGSGWMMTKVT